jgi:hypothetical protein
MTDQIREDIQEEALRIMKEGDAQGTLLRLLGGLAIRLHSPSASHRALSRSYPDLDFATPVRRSQAVEMLITRLGYEPNKTFNLLNGDGRLLFYDQPRGRQIDVFVGRFEMCHRLPITERLSLDPMTLPLAELLLTKLQIVQMNEKDIRDICAVMIDHPLGDGDEEMINLPRVAQICAEDWGLWKTVTLSLKKVQDSLNTYSLEPEARANLEQRLGTLRQALDDAPKPLRWKMRARIGEKMPWYELPEEVRRG